MSLIEEDDDEEEEPKLQAPMQKTMIVGENQIPMVYTPKPQPLKKRRFKSTTKRTRDKEIEQIKKEITTKQPPKRVCMREVV